VVLTRHAVEHLLHTSGRGRCGGGSATQAPEPPAGAAALAGGPRGDAAGRRAAGDRWRRRAAVGSGRRPLHRAARHGARADVRPPGLRDRAIPPGHTLTLATSRPGSAIPARHAKSARRWGEIRSPSSCRATASSPPAARPADFPPPAASPPSSACSKSSAPDGQRADPVRPGRGVRAAATPRVADGPLRRR
jgi:hypothetical protein